MYVLVSRASPSGLEDAGEHSKNECCQERLSEILEWLLKMGFDLEDIQKCIEGKKAATIPPTPPSRPSSTNGNSSSEDLNFLFITLLKIVVFDIGKGKSAENRKRRHSKSSRRKQPKPKRSRSEGMFDNTCMRIMGGAQLLCSM